MKSKVVLFLGAGFSRAFDLPVMTEFTDCIRDHARIDDTHRAVFREVIKDARQANSFLQSHPKNVEDLLSLAEMAQRLGISDDSRAQCIRRTLGAVYSGLVPDRDRTQWAHRFARLIEYSHDQRRRVLERYSTAGFSVVTTNYDLNAEYLLTDLQFGVKPGTSNQDDTFRYDGSNLYSAADPASVPICKLHGAVNWFEGENGTIFVDDNPQDVFSAKGRPRICSYKTSDNRTPLLVPPSFLKPQLSRAMQTVWKEAAHLLSEANFIVFIGYSFPETDTEMAYFLAASLWANTELSKIIIVDPNADELVRKLRHGRFGNHFLNLVESVASPWQEATSLRVPFGWGMGATSSR